MPKRHTRRFVLGGLGTAAGLLALPTTSRGQTTCPLVPLPSGQSSLPFVQDTPNPGGATKKVFAHYFPPFPLSFENAAPSSDNYAAVYLNPFGESNTYLSGGGYLRSRSITEVSGDVAWKARNYEKEVQRAIAIGLDGFIFDVFSDLNTSPNPWVWLDKSTLMLDAALTVDSRFKIACMVDMSGDRFAATPLAILPAIRLYAAHASAYRLGDGRLFVSAFMAEAQTAAFWSSIKTTLLGEGISIAFVPVFVDGVLAGTPTHLSQFSPFSYGVSEWGAREPDYTWLSDTADAAHTAGMAFMAPVAPQDWRPKNLSWFETECSRTFRTGWAEAIASDSEFVQLITWNDYSESSQIAPSLADDGKMERGFYDLAAYYIQWFKTGVQPTITKNVLYYFHRRHASTLQPTTTAQQTGTFSLWGGYPVQNIVELLGFLRHAGQLQITIGSQVTTASASAGITSMTAPLQVGTPNFSFIRSGTTVFSFPSQTPIVSSITRSNYTYESGSASAMGTNFTYTG